MTRKITRGIASILVGELDRLYLGNLDAKRDWGFAGDYVEAIWRIVQHEYPDDFVVATGDTRSVRDFLAATFGLVGLDWEDFVETEDRYRRPAEVPALMGDATKARRVLGWNPKVQFPELCEMMLAADLAEKGLTLEKARVLAARLKPVRTR